MFLGKQVTSYTEVDYSGCGSLVEWKSEGDDVLRMIKAVAEIENAHSKFHNYVTPKAMTAGILLKFFESSFYLVF